MLINLTLIFVFVILQAPASSALPLDGSTNEKWCIFAQKLDHFDENSQEYFAQRFLPISTHYKHGGPIFLMIGGQNEISSDTFSNSLSVDLAAHHNAYFVYLEHRYYGASSPVAYVTTEDLQWLTVDQALNDIHDFIEYIRNDVIDNPRAPILLIGSQYAGSLAVWYQHLYPDNVSAVLALSASILAKIDYSDFFVFVGERIRRVGGKGCYERLDIGIRKAEKLFEEKLFAELSAEYSICNKTHPEHHIRTFTGVLAFAVRQAALAGNRNDYIQKLCEKLNAEPKLSAFANVVREEFGNNCYPLDPNPWLAQLKLKPNMLWLYQHCWELGQIPNASSRNQPFGTQLPVDLFYNICQSSFGFDKQSMHQRTEAFNRKFGGLNPLVKSIIFVNGEYDPNESLQIRTPLNNRTLVINIAGEGQLPMDLSSISSYDSGEIVSAKQKISSIISSIF